MIRRPMNCLSIAALAWIFLGAPDLVPAQQPGAAIAEPAIYAPGVPPVYLSAKHAKLCTTRVGDRLPSVELPRLDGSPATPQSLSGEQATVVLFWSSDGWMSRAALRDLGRDIAAEFDPKLVSLVGVAVESPEAAVRESIRVAGAKFPQFLDADGALMRREA